MIIVNEKKKTLTITKSFEKAASKFGSDEYDKLQEAKKDHPKFKVVIAEAAKAGDHMKGLTHVYMLNYIRNHEKNVKFEGEDVSILIAFLAYAGRDKNGDHIKTSHVKSYGELKKWFLEQYPELAPKKEEDAFKKALFKNDTSSKESASSTAEH